MKKGNGEGPLRADPEIPETGRNRESVENVILCVARAERLVKEIGKSLLDSGNLSAKDPDDSRDWFLSDED
jgi:hypothetical protein